MIDRRTMQISTPGDTSIQIVRAFDAPRALVFDAFTKPAIVRRWLTGPPGWTMPVCEIDLRVGGAFHYRWQNADGRAFSLHGTFRELRPAARTVHTEVFDDDWTNGETVVATDFDGGDVTVVTMTIQYQTQEVRDLALKTAVTGMKTSFDRLDEMFAAEGGQQ